MDQITIPSQPENISMVEPFVEGVRSRFQIGEEIYGNILISLTEAVNNAIIHGNDCDPDKAVNLSYELLPHSRMISFRVKDQGIGFDYNDLQDPTAPENVGKVTGRGVFLMKQLSDWIIFSDEGKCIEIQFKI